MADTKAANARPSEYQIKDVADATPDKFNYDGSGDQSGEQNASTRFSGFPRDGGPELGGKIKVRRGFGKARGA